MEVALVISASPRAKGESSQKNFTFLPTDGNVCFANFNIYSASNVKDLEPI